MKKENAGAVGDSVKILIDPNDPGCWIKDAPKTVSTTIAAIIISAIFCGIFEAVLVIMMTTLK